MANPLMAWLRGDDLKAKDLAVPERKMIYYDPGVAIRAGTLVHGPGATDLIENAFGYGNDGNSAVYACLSAICTAYPEAPLRVWRSEQDGKRTHLPDNPLQELLDNPNPHMSPAQLWYWTQWVKHVDGNAYWRKVRSGNAETGNVVQLWPVSPRLMHPWTEKGSDNFIDAYRYQYASGRFEYVSPANVIHFKLGIDDRDHRIGMSPLKRLAREILGDEEASKWQATMLANGGSAGMLVQVPKETVMTPEAAADLQNRIAAKFTGENRGRVGILTGGATMAPYGFNPEQMDMRSLHRIPEERISAVLRVPAIVAGLGAGLDRSTYSNVREAREQFAEQTILPLYSFDQADINTQLLPDFTPDRRIMAAFDTSDMRALQEDADKQYARLSVAVEKRWITKNEARSEVGLPPIEGGDVFDAPVAPTVPVIPEATKGRRVLELKGADLEAMPDLLAALQELAAPAFEKDMEKYFDGQRKRVKGRLMEQATSAPALPAPAPTQPYTVRKRVEHDDQGRIASVIEEYEPTPVPFQPYTVRKRVQHDAQDRISAVVEHHEPTEQEGAA